MVGRYLLRLHLWQHDDAPDPDEHPHDQAPQAHGPHPAHHEHPGPSRQPPAADPPVPPLPGGAPQHQRIQPPDAGPQRQPVHRAEGPPVQADVLAGPVLHRGAHELPPEPAPGDGRGHLLPWRRRHPVRRRGRADVLRGQRQAGRPQLEQRGDRQDVRKPVLRRDRAADLHPSAGLDTGRDVLPARHDREGHLHPDLGCLPRTEEPDVGGHEAVQEPQRRRL
mmetsp:Transcript_81718/g.221407  ORF Transcript_81718/g.221407 Transcript_81718/m.221407 type:complete len:222 (-) Transcript_81718:689-1354(-)